MDTRTSSTKKTNLFPVSGTRDFYPKDALRKNWLLDGWRKTSLGCNFKEYDTSIVEHANLWKTKNGGNDDIMKEMFSVSDGNPHVELVLRPEMTPSVCRMALKHLRNDVLPFKWFSVPQCWRNETTTVGRGREFYQWNCDIFGADSFKYEAELLWVIVSFLKTVGLSANDVVIKISNKLFIESYLKGKFNGDITAVFNIIDKMNKKDSAEIEQLLLSTGMDSPTIEGLFDLIKIKDISLLKERLGESAVSDTHKLFDLLNVYGILDWIELDLSIARGLSYYTGIIFEGVFKNTAMKRSICGGGRYDDLLTSFGHKRRIPCIGFGMGDMPILEGLSELGKLPDFSSKCDYCVIAFPNLYDEAVKIANTLRDKGNVVDIYIHSNPNNLKVKNAYNYADRIGAEKVILVAPDEFARNSVRVKCLRDKDSTGTSKEEEVLISDL